MYYIYCYTNNLNGKKYIGQTNAIGRRKGEHKYAAFNPDAKDYNLLFHQKLRQYGLENFTFEILEEIDTLDLDYVDEREQYWIKEKESFVKTGKGYNITLGGQQQARHRQIDNKTVLQIIDLLQNSDLSQKAIGEKFGIAESTMIKINRGEYLGQPNIKYPIRINNISGDVKQSIAFLLVNSNMTQVAIAKQFGVSRSTVKRIQNGEIKIEGYNTYPLRQKIQNENN